MASEDVKQRGEGAVSTIVNLAEEAKAATEGVKSPKYALFTISKSLAAGGIAGAVFSNVFMGTDSFEDDCEHFIANCVSDLREVGIKFKPRYKLSFWEIQFNQSFGVLEIHPFKIDIATETVFRNLIAFEQCHMNNPEDMVITNYVSFIDNLIDTGSDVAYLHKAGIIVHYLGSDQEVADFFNRLVKRVYVSKKTGVLREVYQKLNEYCSHRRNWWRGSLHNEYLRNPWVIISIFAALLLFLLTVVQTGYTVYAYYKPPS